MNQRMFITGIGGFVGKHLAEMLREEGIDVWGIERNPPEDNEDTQLLKGDMRDAAAVRDALEQAQPDFIFHLAGFSSVAKSFTDEGEVFRVNVDGTKNLLDAARELKKSPHILIVSSSEVYGKPDKNPVAETAPRKPITPYGESRVQQEELVHAYTDLHIVISRSFNHTGPGQSPTFAVSSFAKQIAMIERGEQKELSVGNLDSVRDISDVRDVIGAYRVLINTGKQHETYNVGSGEGVRMKDLLTLLIGLSPRPIRVETDPAKLRPADIPEIVADTRKYHELTGFPTSSLTDKQRIPLLQTLEDTLEYWRNYQVFQAPISN